jgi:hypothetical protein
MLDGKLPNPKRSVGRYSRIALGMKRWEVTLTATGTGEDNLGSI